MASNTVEVTTKAGKHSVTFDLKRMIEIEERLGKTPLQVLSEFSVLAASSDEASAQEKVSAASQFSVVKSAKFICACLGCADNTIEEYVGIANFRLAFTTLLQGFVEAVKELNGMSDVDPQQAQAPSGV